MSMRLVLQAIPLMALLFILFPRIPGPFWALPNGSNTAITGLSNRMTPGDISSLALSDDIAFRVRFDGRAPAPADFYWRGPVMSRFDGRTWSPQETRPRPEQAPTAYDIERSLTYELTLEPHGQKWLLALETPATWDASKAELSAELQLVSPTRINRRTAYRARSVPGRAVADNLDAMTLRHTTFSPRLRNQKSQQLARDMRARANTDRAFLNDVLEWFRREQFYYTLNPPTLGADSVDEFLFDTREGFCGHYASAFAVMARAAGIPARIVTGYLGAERNPMADYWIVRQSDAHAWVEVWLDDRWVRFDPTAAVAPERIELGFDDAVDRSAVPGGFRLRSNPIMRRVAMSWDAVNAGWNRWVLSFGPARQMTLLGALGIPSPSANHLITVMTCAVLIFLVGIGLLQRNYHRPPRERLQQAYRRLCARTEKAVRRRLPTEGPEEYAASIAQLRPDLAAELHALFEMYVRLRYDGVDDDNLKRRFIEAVKNFRPHPRPVAAAP